MSDLAGPLDRGQPIVRQIQSILKGKIRNGEIGPGTRLPSMRRLSTEFGCSLGIVKQAVNILVAQGYLRSSPRRGVFVADTTPAAREVVLILPHLGIERLRLGLLGVRRGLGDSEFRISIHAGEGSAGQTSPIPDYLASPQVAGVLLLLPSAGEHERLLDMLRRHGVPTVVVDTSARVAGADVVAIDALGTGRQGAEHLIERGHRRIALIEPKEDPRTPPEVVDGVERAISDAGLGELVRIAVTRPEPGAGFTWQAAREQVASALRERPDITGLIGLGPQLTLGGFLALRDLGRRVPEQVSVLGLLGDSSGLQTMEPPITIFETNLMEVCEQATRRLLERIDGLSTPPESIRQAPILIQRQSVGSAS